MTIKQLRDRIATIVCNNSMSELGIDDLEEIGCIIELLHNADYLTDVERNLMLQRVQDMIAEEEAEGFIDVDTFNWSYKLREAEGIMRRVRIPYGRWKLYGYSVREIVIAGHSYYGLMMDRTGYIKGYMVMTDEYRDKAKAIIEEVERLNAKKSKLRETKENADNANTISNDKGEAPDSE